MCCVDIIKSGIARVRNESKSNMKRMDAKSIDTMLDKILEMQKGIDALTGVTEWLYNQFYEHFHEITREDYDLFKNDLHELNQLLVRVLAMYKRSEYYQGIKTKVQELQHVVDSLREMENDIKVFRIELPDDDEYKQLVAAFAFI